MAYEDELNQEAVELEQGTAEPEQETTAETPAEETEISAENAPEAETAEVTELSAEDAPADETPVQDSAEEQPSEEKEEEKPTSEPLAEEPDEDLSDASDDETEIEFEIEMQEPKTKFIAGKVQEVRSNMQEKYTEARTACKDMMDRLAYDMEQTNYNPYIRTTITRKYEILRSSSDTEPVDVFEFEKTSGFSLRAMALTSALVAVADIAVSRWIRKKL